jgi:ribulose-phosphate 3-epimerase
MPEVAPSMLAADFANLAHDIGVVKNAGARILHVDVMDGHFVPNISIGVPVVRSLRRATDLLLDVHLMISNPEDMVDAFIDAGADYLTVHYEATNNLDQLVTRIRSKGVKAGVVLNPHTPVPLLEEVLHRCDLVLIMSVNPGFGGQEFISTSFEKVRKLRELIAAQHLNVQIEIDGGIYQHNAAEAVRSGVDILVAGSAIFGSNDPAAAFRSMQNIADQAGGEV